MQSPLKLKWDRERNTYTVIWDGYFALLALEAQAAAVKTAIAEKRLTRHMLDVFSRNFTEEAISELLALLKREVQDAD